jgi:hypothetical protein
MDHMEVERMKVEHMELKRMEVEHMEVERTKGGGYGPSFPLLVPGGGAYGGGGYEYEPYG